MTIVERQLLFRCQENIIDDDDVPATALAPTDVNFVFLLSL